MTAVPSDRRGLSFLELVEVMDRLRSPQGCPWDREQTHASLAPYAVEEVYELVEAIESGGRAHLREELGDVLLQVVFHARIAQEDPQEPFDIDQVADGITAKLRRRHPHVFADVQADTPAQVSANWAAIKAAEKPERRGLYDGIPAGLPELARAEAMLTRLERANRLDLASTAIEQAPGDDLGMAMLALVLAARSAGVDAGAALRKALRTLQEASEGVPPAPSHA